MLAGLDGVVDLLVTTDGLFGPHLRFILGEMSSVPFNSVIGPPYYDATSIDIS